VWAVLDGPVGKQLAPFVGEIVGRLRACRELDIAEETAAKLCAMSAASTHYTPTMPSTGA
jgi:hypothetical protein